MPRTKGYMEIKILHSFVVQQNPGINQHDAKACATAYGKQQFGDDLLSTGESTISDGPHGKVIETSFEFWQGEEDVPAGDAQTFKAAEGA